LKRHPRLGLDLLAHPVYGDLSDCKKIYFDEEADVSPRWRIVYRLMPNAANPTSVEIVSIGRRQYAEAYTVAVRRLGR
jgi:hypothetical protein